jgi:H+/Cl- antiporter ClcA
LRLRFDGRRSKFLLRKSKHLWLSPRIWIRRLLFWSGAIGVGGAAIFFAVSSEYANRLFLKAVTYSPFTPLILSPLGLALVVTITRNFFPGSQGSGIPQTIAALRMRELSSRSAVLSLKIAIGKIMLTVLGLLSGASVGREGPTVQVGASIMHALGRVVHFPRHELEKGLILAGGAAGIAAAFNTPLAGVVFAIEEMSRSFEHRTSGTVLTAVIVAGITSLAILGNYTYFGHTSATLNLRQGWIAILLCGMVGGWLGGIFSRVLISVDKGLPGALGKNIRNRPVLFAAVCGILLAIIGIVSGGTSYGTGYHEAKHLVEGTGRLPEAYGVFKMLATTISYISGIPGGIFAPSLAIGAGFGSNLAALLPGVQSGAVVILGMVAYFSGVVQAPITAFVIVMEMTDNQ